MKTNGYDEEFAERCFKQICGFGEYGFPESHAASFALLVYVSAWLKRYHPAAFAAALINSQPMGFYAPAQIVRDAVDHGVPVRGPDVSFSEYDCMLEERHEAIKPPMASAGEGEKSRKVEKSKSRNDGVGGPAIRLGFRLIRGISEAKVAGIAAARRERAFHSVADVARRGGASRNTLVRLAAADAFRSLGLNRRQALWRVLALDDQPGLFEELEPAEPPVRLPPIDLEEQVVQDYDTIGMSLTAHPISLVRRQLEAIGVSPNERLKTLRPGQRVSVSGLVLVRQRPSTAKGVVFMTLEDETGIANLIIRPRVWERWRRAARTSIAVVARGAVERQGEVIHVMVHKVEDLSETLAAIPSVSRDFH